MLSRAGGDYGTGALTLCLPVQAPRCSSPMDRGQGLQPHRMARPTLTPGSPCTHLLGPQPRPTRSTPRNRPTRPTRTSPLLGTPPWTPSSSSGLVRRAPSSNRHTASPLRDTPPAFHPVATPSPSHNSGLANTVCCTSSCHLFVPHVSLHHLSLYLPVAGRHASKVHSVGAPHGW